MSISNPPPPPSTERPAKNRQWIGWLVSLACIIGLGWLIDVQRVWELLQTADLVYLTASFAAVIAFLLLRAVRWRFLLGNDVPFMQTFHIQNIGYLFTTLLPLRLGDVVRVILIGQAPKVTILQATSTMIIERILDLLFFVVLFPFAVAQLPAVPDRLQFAAQTAGILLGGSTVGLIIAAQYRHKLPDLIERWLPGRPTLIKRIDDLLTGLDTLTNWRQALQLLAYSLVVWLPVLLAYHWGLLALGRRIPPVHVLLTVSCAAFGVAAPSSPGQLGVFHAAVTFALVTLLGYPENTAVAFAILIHALQSGVYLIVGAIALNRTGHSWGKVVQMARDFRAGRS